MPVCASPCTPASGHGRGAALDATIELGAATDTGRLRTHNEDSHLARHNLAAVADGMGGHAAGDVASACAIAALNAIADTPTLRTEDIQGALEQANTAIIAEVARTPEKAGMGTTITGVALIDYGGSAHWLVFNIGDSRVYRICGDAAIQLTVDHSEVGELLALGRITPPEVASHPLRHVITRSLGTDPAPVADLWIFPVSAVGDLFVACSDGLSNEIDDASIARIVSSTRWPQDAAEALVGSALKAGGRDNVTAVVVRADATEEDEALANTTPRSGLEATR